MPKESLYALIGVYQAQIEWLITQATELESGERQILSSLRGKQIDLPQTPPRDIEVARTTCRPFWKPTKGSTRKAPEAH